MSAPLRRERLHLATGYLYINGERVGSVWLYTSAEIDAHVQDCLAKRLSPGLRWSRYGGPAPYEMVNR